MNNYKSILKKYKAILIALLFLMLCFGIINIVISLINDTLLYVTSFARNTWLDLFFIFITFSLLYEFYRTWIKNKKIISPENASLILIPVVLYLYFRLDKNSPYCFTCFWDGPISYLDVPTLLGIILIVIFIVQQFKKNNIFDNKEINSFIKDDPIKGADDDLFKMDNMISRIVDYISFANLRESAFSIGIVGEWGEGKTSLMNLIEEKVKKIHNDYIIVHFRPRSAKRADTIQADFFNSLKQSLSPYHSGIDHTIDKYVFSLDIIPTTIPIIKKLEELVHGILEKKYEINRGELSKAITDINRRIIVFIDDLDRLTGAELIEVLKVLDTNGSFPNILFLTAYDKSYVNNVLINYLKLGNHKCNFTDKYFDVEIPVPIHSPFIIIDFLKALLLKEIKDGTIQVNSDEIISLLSYKHDILVKRLYSVRYVKRFVNQFLYDFIPMQKDVVFQDFFLLELIRFAHPEEYYSLYHKQYIISKSSIIPGGYSEALWYLKDEFFTDDKLPVCTDILKELFPLGKEGSWYDRRRKRIYSKSSFEFYFYNYEYKHLTSGEVNELLSLQLPHSYNRMQYYISEYGKDVETALCTTNYLEFDDKDALKRFFHIILCSLNNDIIDSINSLYTALAFVRKEDAQKIIEKYYFNNKETYVEWLINAQQELLYVEPLAVSFYIQNTIDYYHKEENDENKYFTEDELQNLAANLFQSYLAMMKNERWNADVCLSMSLILDKDGKMNKDVCQALRRSISNNLSNYSSHLIQISYNVSNAINDAITPGSYKTENGIVVTEAQKSQTYAGITPKFRFKEVFPIMTDFEKILGEQDDTIPGIHRLSNFWKVYKAKNYRRFALSCNISPKDYLVYDFNKELEDLESSK